MEGFDKFVDWVFYAMIGGFAYCGVYILWQLKQSIDLLNQKIAVIVEKVSRHDKDIERHDGRIQALETKRRSK